MSASWMISSLSPYLNAPMFHDVVFHVRHAAANMPNDSLMELDDQQVNDTVIYAHAVVLCGRSPTFHSIFIDKAQSLITPAFTFAIRSTASRSQTIRVSALAPYSRALTKTFSMIVEYMYTQVFDIGRWQDDADVAADASSAWILLLTLVTTLRMSALFSKVSQFALLNASAVYGAFLQQQRSQSADNVTTRHCALSGDDRSSDFLSMSALCFGRHKATRGVYVRVPDTSDDAVIATRDTTRLYGERVIVNSQRYVRYKVDPLLLAARSPVFTAMFAGDWRESQRKMR